MQSVMLKFLFFLCISTRLLNAQTESSLLFIDSIKIHGYDRTKLRIIKREMNLKIGDSLNMADLNSKLLFNRNRLFNTNLFSYCDLKFKCDSTLQHGTVDVGLTEKWAIYPGIILKPADRNINVWLKDFGAGLDRLNYGISLSHVNTSGNRDPLILTMQLGYTPKIALAYDFPYIDKKQQWLVSFDIGYSNNHEVFYNTINNKWIPFNDTLKNINKSFVTEWGLIKQPELFTQHYFALGYAFNHVDQIIGTDLNPNYFGDGATRQQYLYAYYSYIHDTRDLGPYPLSGHLISATLVKYGLTPADDVNLLNLQLKVSQAFKFSRKWSASTVWKVKTSLIRDNVPYNFSHAFGFGSDYIRGYELYVVDGLDFGYSKNTLHYELYNRDIKLDKYIKPNWLKGFRNVPFRCYLSAHFDAGISNGGSTESSNSFYGQVQYGYGLGFDAVVYHNSVFAIQYSINRVGEKGFFIHQSIAF